MGLTLNQVRNRIERIALAHSQVRSFKKGLISDQLTEHTARYPAVYLSGPGQGSISISSRAAVINYQLFIMDLVHVSEDTKLNEEDVLSDMFSIAQDLVAQMNSAVYTDWRVSPDNNLQIVVEDESDMRAGVVLDFSISTMYTQDLCAVPSDLIDITPVDNTDMKLVYDIEYIATGAEGTALSIPTVLGKKILLITRENNPLHKVSNLPDSAEFAWDDTIITLGAATNAGERFLILYRTY